MRQNNEHRNKNMLLIVTFAFVAFVIITLRAFQISVQKEVNDVDLVQMNEKEFSRSSITSANRGTIYDSQSRPIAMDTTSYSLYAVLKKDGYEEAVEEPEYVSKRLAEILDMNRDELLNKLLTKNVYQVEFGAKGRKLSKEIRDKIKAANLKGIHFKEETKRVYVNDFYASHIIGYSAVNQELSEGLSVDIQEGKMGLELLFDKQLSGVEAYKSRVLKGETDNYLAGQDLYLTLDSRLQNYLEELMSNAFQHYKPKQMMGYLVEVETGKLLAATQRPTFNLNTLEGVDKEWRNLLVEESYEPGSTIKILTLASAIEKGTISLNEYFESGKIDVYDQEVRDYNRYGWGPITFEQALIRSSNVGMVKIVEKMGVDQWQQELVKYGFGQKTESGFVNESAGNINFDNPVNAMMSSFGQGLSVTPIQLLESFIAIGNKGERLQIQMVDGIGSQQTIQKKSLGQVMKVETARTILNIMQKSTTEDYGTGLVFHNPNINVAVKTGTAEIANIEKSGYLTGENDYLYSVISFFPAEKPKYMLYLAVKQPEAETSLNGTHILAEIFNKFVDYVVIRN